MRYICLRIEASRLSAAQFSTDMVNRTYVRCLECEHDTMVRTAMGHGDYAEYAFPCPSCGVEIRFGIDLYPDTGRWKYGDLTNAQWIETKGLLELPDVIYCDSETLIPKTMTRGHFSPFLQSSHLPLDFAVYHQEREQRFHLCERVWPVIRRCKSFLDREQWKPYAKAASDIDPRFKVGSKEHNSAHFLAVLDSFSEKFRPFSENRRNQAISQIRAAETASQSACNDLHAYLRSIGWNTELLREVYSIKDRWVETTFWVVAPIYMMLYWDGDKNSISDYYLAQKRFQDAKVAYVDSWETLARISVLAMAVEGIAQTGNCVVPRPSGDEMSLDAFRSLNNGNKYDLIKPRAISGIFSALQDNRIRNGVGHHSAHYDVLADSIEYRVENSKGVTQQIMPYTDFCVKLLNLHVNLEVSSVYLKWCLFREWGTTRSFSL